jgi:signal transduction histidine kinase
MSERNPDGKRKTDAGAARDRLAAVGFIASLLGHRARNQLATIRAALELLHAGMEANMTPEYRATVLREVDALVGDFNLGVDMVRCDYGPLQGLSAQAAIDEALLEFAPLAQRRGVRLERRFDPAADRMRSDPRLLRLVLLNLLRNSLRAVDGVPAPIVAIRTETAEGRCIVEVEDNGPGVAAELRGRLFAEPVTGWGGTGLGLVLCRDAMTVMEGTIRYCPPAGAAGARFRLDFPAERAGS